MRLSTLLYIYWKFENTLLSTACSSCLDSFLFLLLVFGWSVGVCVWVWGGGGSRHEFFVRYMYYKELLHLCGLLFYSFTGVFWRMLPRWHPWEGIHLQCRRHRFQPWVWKTPWKRRRQPAPGSWPRDARGLAGCSPRGCQELRMIARV